jgi:hypothetical protein
MTGDQEIVRSFLFLENELGYSRVRNDYDPLHFGNAIVEYRSPLLRIRVTKDRGGFLCDFAAPGAQEWFDQEIVFRVLGEDQAVQDLIAQRWSSLDAVAASVKQTIVRISGLFSEESYAESRARFQDSQRRRATDLFGDQDKPAGKRDV